MPYGFPIQTPRPGAPRRNSAGLPSYSSPMGQAPAPSGGLNTGLSGGINTQGWGAATPLNGTGGGFMGPGINTAPVNPMGQQAWMGGAMGGPGNFSTGLGGSMAPMQNPQVSPSGGQGGAGGNFNAQYGTTGNLGPYGSGWAPTPYQYQQPAPYQAPGAFNMETDPGFIFARDQAMEAIQNSAAARGGLHSTGTMNDLADRLTGLGHQFANDAYSRYNADRNFGRSTFESDRGFGRGVYESDRGFGENSLQSAFNRFGQDRNYMTDVFRDNRDFNYQGFRDQQGDFNQRMALQQMAEMGLAGNAQDWSRMAAGLPAVFAQIIAQLYGDQGNTRAAGTMNGANITSNMLQQMIGLGGRAFGGMG